MMPPYPEVTDSDPKVVGIIQARMSSSRLPGKSMMDLCGYPILQWVIERCKRASRLHEVVVATTTSTDDDLLVELGQTLGIQIFRGSEENVLKRFVNAAKHYSATIVVRICADNPLVSPEEIDRIVDLYLTTPSDYVFNHIPQLNNNYPDGLGAEVLSTSLLEKISNLALHKKYREHVTLYLWEHKESFNIRTLPCPRQYNLPEMKLDIDTLDDLNDMRKICKNLSFKSKPAEIFKQWTQA